MAVGPRASKEEFMQALGLNSHDPQHEQYYRAMRDEAILTYNHLNEDRSNLLDSVAADPSTKPPYFWHHIRPERQRWGILEIARNAGPLTRPLFARGAVVTSAASPTNTTTGGAAATGPGGGGAAGAAGGDTTAAGGGEYGPNWVAGWLLYSVFRSRDVRNNRNRRRGEERGRSKSPQRQPQPQSQTNSGVSGKKEYYDPVRNG
ncbi:uncharacterized protein BO95DRAFT_8358 [Aspergillus brunneoviolaceus CBS 621.78]|uniref:Uncharacterized protein n=1 Tax=Aspergillus brunneoviolaceus CBS 621.78 TaxID=1450534 RepID=A0ACD1GQU6_9EURO|nr:hypothetical protein BO95DRAFT_8358 [Aspergillus brunneoviolaceus CBS 621.78]RAH51611.1 hypothetical protein BO95DRAFT_8358 [Aspergillus brunneoviolaceus CBS 621.78]